MVTIDSKLGLAIYRIGASYSPGRFLHFIETSIEMLIHEGISNFIIDFSELTTCTTRELMSLVKAAGSLPAGAIILTGAHDDMTRLLKMTGLYKIFRVYDDVQTAMKSIITDRGTDEEKHALKRDEELKISSRMASA